MLSLFSSLCAELVLFISGGGGAGHQLSVPEVSQEAQRHDELPVQHAQR